MHASPGDDAWLVMLRATKARLIAGLSDFDQGRGYTLSPAVNIRSD